MHGRSEGMLEPVYPPVPGSIGPTGRFKPSFKTMYKGVLTYILDEINMDLTFLSKTYLVVLISHGKKLELKRFQIKKKVKIKKRVLLVILY